LIAQLVVQAVASAIEKADPDDMPLARQVNAISVTLPHQGLPAGPHIGEYGKDKTEF
jgi:hypothetical protein